MADLYKLARKEKLDELETAWLEEASRDMVDVDWMMRVVRWLHEHDHPATAETLTWYLADALNERGETQAALDAARQGVRIMPQSEMLRDVLAQMYVVARSDRDDIEELVRLTLRDSNQPADAALHALENVLSLTPGSYVLDPQSGEVGRVQQFDPDEGGLWVDFGDSERTYGLGLISRLEVVPEDDFRALAAFEKERLQKMADEDPEELIEMLLSTIDRRMPLRRIRLYLDPVLDNWSKWWSKARGVLKRSARIGMTPGNSPSVFLRSEPLSHGERLLRKFDKLEEPLAILSMALHLMREARDHGHPEPTRLAEVLERVAEVGTGAAEARSHMALCAHAVIDAACSEFPDVAAPEAPETQPLGPALQAPQSLVEQVPDPELQQMALDYVHKRAPERWPAFYAGVIHVAGRQVCTHAARRLAAQKPDVMANVCREIMASPEPSVGALTWLWRLGMSRGEELPAKVNMVDLVMKMLVCMSAIVRSRDVSEDERKEKHAELRAALLLRNGDPLREVLQRASADKISSIKGLTEYNSGLTDHARETVLGILEKLQPELFSEELPPWEEKVTYTTQAGLDRRREELEYLVHERIPEVIKEIGEAAEFGDLSENAEYSAAIEERARLAQRAGRMQEEIAESRIITHEMADMDHVTVGSRVRAENLDTGEERTFTFLGPWDADRSEDIVAYNAPLGQAFMGKGVGDEVTFSMGPEHHRYRVLEFEPAV